MQDRHDLFCKACSGKGLAYSAKRRILNGMLYVRNVHLTKGQTYSLMINATSCQDGSYMKTNTARAQLKKEYLAVSLKRLDTKTN
jgi:hypothetical protein